MPENDFEYFSSIFLRIQAVLKSLCILIVLATLPAAAQLSEQWGNLKEGPYRVGYTTMMGKDSSRNYLPSYKPLQMYIWYPTRASRSSTMRFGEYVEDAAADFNQDTVYTRLLSVSLKEEFKNGNMNPSFNGKFTDAAFERVLNTPVAAIRNALPAPGKFPLLLHTHANGVLHQSILLEYLASHGFVVVSFSMYNTAPVHYGRGEEGAASLLSYSGDLGYILAKARQLNFVDGEKAAMIGMLAQVGLAYQFREPMLDAIACLDCPANWNWQAMHRLPFYDVRKIRIPILEVINSQVPEQRLTFLDSLHYSQRYVVRNTNLPHADFYPFPKIANPEDARKFLNYELISEMVRLFLSSELHDDDTAMPRLQDLVNGNSGGENNMSMKMVPAIPAKLTENEFLTALRFGNLAEVKSALSDQGYETSLNAANFFSVVLFLCRDGAPHAFDAISIYSGAYPEDQRIGFLYRLLGQSLLEKEPLLAVRAFSEAVRRFPEDLYSLEGLAHAYSASDNSVKAEEVMNNVLQLLPASQLSAQEKENMRTRIEGKLKAE